MVGSWKRALLVLVIVLPVLVGIAVGLAFIEWIRWTPGGAAFFACIALALTVLTVCEIARPCIERKGFLPMPTTRGDRFFIALLSAALLHMINLILLPGLPWIASILAAIWLAVLMRWG